MKKSLKNKYQYLLFIFFAIFILESILIILTILRPIPLQQLKLDIQSIVIFFIFVQFIYFVILFYYVPYKYEVAYREVHQLINEITEGKYQIDFDLKTYLQDAEIQSLIKAMQRMMDIITRFDNLKSEKVYEHHQRLQLLINMLPQGCMIMSAIGEVVYCNNYIKDNFPVLIESLNVLETMLPEHLETSLKPLIADSIKYGNNLHDTEFEIASLGKRFLLNTSIVHNRKGQITGAIFVIVDVESPISIAISQ
jgi:signal transduction histidine kinase